MDKDANGNEFWVHTIGLSRPAKPRQRIAMPNNTAPCGSGGVSLGKLAHDPHRDHLGKRDASTHENRCIAWTP